jgi:type IV pilus assembly protein PilV
MAKQNLFTAKNSQKGAVLLEALIAIAIFAMGILALVGLQATMLQNTTDAKYRADASYIAQQQIGRMWADPANAASYLVSDTSLLPPVLPSGKLTITQPVAGQFRVVVGWTAPDETPAASATTAPCFMTVAHCFTTTASISGG